jgi:hypothetical protein
MLDATLSDLVRLEGYALSQGDQAVAFADLVPGQPFTLTLYWRALSTLHEIYHIFVHVQTADESMLTASDGPPLEGAYPTMIWDAGEVVATTHTLTLPPDVGTFTVHTGLYRWPDLTRLYVVQNGAPTADQRVILWPLP